VLDETYVFYVRNKETNVVNERFRINGPLMYVTKVLVALNVTSDRLGDYEEYMYCSQKDFVTLTSVN
jgi:hypothetical protein